MAAYCEHHQKWVPGDACVDEGHPVKVEPPATVAPVKRAIAKVVPKKAK